MLGQPTLILLCFTLASSWPQLVWGGDPWDSSTLPFGDGIVYRGDSITPDQLRKRDGFWPKGLTPGRQAFPLAANISLFRHTEESIEVNNRDSWGFIQTSSRYELALNWINVRDLVPGYVYAIHATPNFVNVKASLLQYQYDKNRGDDAYAALGSIPYNQIMAWRRVDVDASQPGVPRVGPVEMNPLYDEAAYGGETWGGAQYDLAGFPDATYEPVAKGLKPWCHTDGCNSRATRAAAQKLLGSRVRVHSLSLHCHLSHDLLSGTNDVILMRIGQSRPITVFKLPGRGAVRNLDVNLDHYFDDGEDLRLSNLTSIRVLHRRGYRIWADAFKIEGIRLEAKTSSSRKTLEMNKFKNMDTWMGTKAAGTTLVWRKGFSLDDWTYVDYD
ncbi:putative heat-labile enterotoxin [Ophiocordyceps polyrhachis-furcata BCC 54312]|uniref:Heat-labile enterotoxin n=1 Tax=Ophiocordyceps polyrhachis-furcata BCC 54312 TaxID=1330021 RepID=A0A367LSF1_9HYPO|nr:putative heat-labile enterotoxin [Ophiocordyceps polyrhachis-furcata BCC 54312]